MEELWLVCEGSRDSVDASVLTPIFVRVLSAGITVVAAGGSSPAVAASFLESQRGGRAAYIIDRDYQRAEEAERSLQDGSKCFLWRRHSIENYLLPPPVVIRAFGQLRARAEQQLAAHLPPWVAALPTDPGQVAEGLRECARRRAAEEACRVAIHRLWEDLSLTAGRIQKRVPALPPGSEAGDTDGWREALRNEAQRLRETAADAAVSPHLRADDVLRRFDEIHGGLTAQEYMASLGFLSDYHGRDLLRQFRQWLETLGVRLSYERLVRELIAAVPEVYRDNRTLFGRDDFLDLANGVRAWAGLVPLG